MLLLPSCKLERETPGHYIVTIFRQLHKYLCNFAPWLRTKLFNALQGEFFETTLHTERINSIIEMCVIFSFDIGYHRTQRGDGREEPLCLGSTSEIAGKNEQARLTSGWVLGENISQRSIVLHIIYYFLTCVGYFLSLRDGENIGGIPNSAIRRTEDIKRECLELDFGDETEKLPCSFERPEKIWGAGVDDLQGAPGGDQASRKDVVG